MMNLLDRLFSYHNTKCKTIERLHSSLAGADFRKAKKLYCSPSPPPPPSSPQWFPPICVLFCYCQTFFCPVLRPSFLICLCPVPVHDTVKSITLMLLFSHQWSSVIFSTDANATGGITSSLHESLAFIFLLQTCSSDFWGISQPLQHSVVWLLLSFISNDCCYKVVLISLFTDLNYHSNYFDYIGLQLLLQLLQLR